MALSFAWIAFSLSQGLSKIAQGTFLFLRFTRSPVIHLRTGLAAPGHGPSPLVAHNTPPPQSTVLFGWFESSFQFPLPLRRLLLFPLPIRCSNSFSTGAFCDERPSPPLPSLLSFLPRSSPRTTHVSPSLPHIIYNTDPSFFFLPLRP